jgi:hypothetical protein
MSGMGYCDGDDIAAHTIFGELQPERCFVFRLVSVLAGAFSSSFLSLSLKISLAIFSFDIAAFHGARYVPSGCAPKTTNCACR